MVAFLQCLSFDELGEDLGLEDLHDVELAATFQLEAFEFLQLPGHVEHSVLLFQHLALLACGREHYAAIGTVDLEGNGHLGAGGILLLLLRVGLVLTIGIGEVCVHVEDGAGVVEAGLLAVRVLEGEVLGEALREQAPYAVGIQLQRNADSFQVLPVKSDDVAAEVSNYACHLHGVPAGAATHNVAVERVQDNLVCQLQGLEKVHYVLALLNLGPITLLHRVLHLSFPDLDLVLILVATIPEGTHGVHVEWILPHAHRVLPHLCARHVYLFVRPLAVLLHSQL